MRPNKLLAAVLLCIQFERMNLESIPSAININERHKMLQFWSWNNMAGRRKRRSNKQIQSMQINILNAFYEFIYMFGVCEIVRRNERTCALGLYMH